VAGVAESAVTSAPAKGETERGGVKGVKSYYQHGQVRIAGVAPELHFPGRRMRKGGSHEDLGDPAGSRSSTTVRRLSCSTAWLTTRMKGHGASGLCSLRRLIAIRNSISPISSRTCTRSGHIRGAVQRKPERLSL
jgi:hypothetical protein